MQWGRNKPQKFKVVPFCQSEIKSECSKTNQNCTNNQCQAYINSTKFKTTIYISQ